VAVLAAEASSMKRLSVGWFSWRNVQHCAHTQKKPAPPLLSSAYPKTKGRRRAGRRHALHVGLHRGRQELREDPLHRAQHLLLRRRHGGGHDERDRDDQQQPRPAPVCDGARLARGDSDDDAQVALVQVRWFVLVGCVLLGGVCSSSSSSSSSSNKQSMAQTNHSSSSNN